MNNTEPILINVIMANNIIVTEQNKFYELLILLLLQIL